MLVAFLNRVFGKSINTGNWKKNIDETIEAGDPEEDVHTDDESPPQPPGGPDRTPVKEPDEKQKPPLGDPQPPSKKKTRM